MSTVYQTDRLTLKPVTETDASFIYELLNTPGWKKFIGERNVNSLTDALNYIRTIISNPAISYWVVSLHEQQTPIGIVTLIKRDYLEYHDIGFAFLPQFTKKGYAFEASKVLLDDLLSSSKHPSIQATTLTGNISSIQLLRKLGFRFTKEINQGEDLLQVYAVSGKQF